MTKISLVMWSAMLFALTVPQAQSQNPPSKTKQKSALVAAKSTSRYVMEAYPDRIAASRQIFFAEKSDSTSGLGYAPKYIIVEASRRWPFDRSVRVAFHGGDEALYAKIAAVANEWISIGGANVKLRFRDASGNFYRWAPSDIVYAGEIRIAFESGKSAGGYWSHVGNDSINSNIDGGAPNQASMNFDSFHITLPPNWRTIVLHEFGHALGFEHEHQNPQGGCDFRLQNDFGYKLSTDPEGYFGKDSSGRRPGLYTYLSGKANFWDKPKVDRNLGTIPNTSAFSVGPFDKFSVMKYFFDGDMFLTGKNSPCFTDRDDTNTLSAQDIVGVREAYPSTDIEIDAINRLTAQALAAIRDSPRATSRVKSNATNQLKHFK